jgi:hypothetical protein
MEEFCAFKRKLWEKFLDRMDHRDSCHPGDAAEVFAIADQLLLGHQARVWDHKNERFQVARAVQIIAKSKKAEDRINENANKFLDVLIQMDNDSLRPVVFAIQNVREAEREEANNASD